ncbi:MAG: putative pilus assembly protein FilE [Acinetobacter gandensis]|uniref:putative pilus assembly protein FilE n=1 Tax=Acinetobacter gandensis TaxID=1443941 RepID=UPI003CFEADC7
MKRNLFVRSILVLSVAQVSYVNAGTFHTIIGPDGRPMVVQKPDQIVQNKPKEKKLHKSEPMTRSEHISAPDYIHAQKNNLEQVEDKIVLPKSINKASASANKSDTDHLDTRKTIETSVSHQQQNIVSNPKSGIPKKQDKPIDLNVDTLNRDVTLSNPKISKQSENVSTSVGQNSETSAVGQIQQQAQSGITIIDGQEYVNNEYLEGKEFNLEGKKRFYTMPEGVIDRKMGATRMQTIEREKGVSKSVLSSMFKKKDQADTGPIVLSQSYYRVSQADTISGLGQQCFSGNKIKKAKSLESFSEVNVWPRAPLTDQFDFEVVKVANSIQNIQINSFASRQNEPTFYWPFVVFLDARGCVLEGTGGYKNNNLQADVLRHEKIEGVIHVPKGSEYLLLTPLASAIDVEDKALTNHGQLKLIAIR